MSVPVEQFFPYISAIAGDVPDFVMRQMLAVTAADMCQQTGCLTMETIIKGKADKAEYAIPLPDDLEAETIRYVYVNDREVAPTRRDELSMRHRGYDWEAVKGEPRGYVVKKKGFITLVPCPSEDCAIRVVSYASVVRTATTLPDEFFYDYLDALVEGTLARIFRLAGQPYSNSQLAAACAMRYSQMLTPIMNEAVRDFSRNAGRVEFNRII